VKPKKIPIKISRKLKKKLLSHSKTAPDQSALFIPCLIKSYKKLWKEKKETLEKTRQKLEVNWSRIENTFFKDLLNFLRIDEESFKIPTRIRCYIVLSYSDFACFDKNTNSIFLGIDAADVYTLAHEIIHLYLHHVLKEKLSDEKKEVLSRIIEYRIIPERARRFIPHWLAGISSKELIILTNLSKKICITNADFQTLRKNISRV